MKFSIILQSTLIWLFFSCSNDTRTNNKPEPTDEYPHAPYTTDTTKVTKEYVSTGFYPLADNLDGIKMRKEQSNEVYSIAQKPAVSVYDISHCSLQLDSLTEGIDGILKIEFDEKGTQNFKDITGNPLHPYIAIVIANRLLYVVEVQGQITTGKNNILLEGYSKKEMQAMVDEINKKR